MTKKELIEKLSQFSDDTIVVVERSFNNWECPRIGYAVVGEHQLPSFPWYIKSDDKKELIGKTIITIS